MRIYDILKYERLCCLDIESKFDSILMKQSNHWLDLSNRTNSVKRNYVDRMWLCSLRDKISLYAI